MTSGRTANPGIMRKRAVPAGNRGSSARRPLLRDRSGQSRKHPRGRSPGATGQCEPDAFAIVRPVGSLVRVITVVDGVVTQMAFGGGTSDSSDYLFAVGPDVTLRWLNILGPDYLEEDWSRDLTPYDGYLIDADRKHLLFYVGLGQFPTGTCQGIEANGS
jgi:hypothetical protein